MRTASKFVFSVNGVRILRIAACAGFGGGPPALPQPQTQIQYSGSVSGHVYCADTNAPARFARVTLIPANTSEGSRGGFGRNTDTTGLDGSFQIQNVAPGTYYVAASLTGYLNPLSLVSSADMTSTDPAAQERVARILSTVSVHGSEGAHAEIRLERGASISGTVSYDDGSPAVNVNIQVNIAPVASSGASPVRAGANFGQQLSRTDDYGRYRIAGMPAGDYIVMATSQFVPPGGFNGQGRGPQSSTLTIYAPKNFRTVDAKVFSLKTGSEMSGADIQIPIAAFHTVSGTVESSDGHTLNAGSLTLTDDKDKAHSFRSSVGSDGQFHFSLCAGG